MMISTDELYSLFQKSTGVNTDSRTVKQGEIFFALKGENFDGNEYAQKALDNGAAYAVVSSGSEIAGRTENNERIIPVEDTLAALKALARKHRCSVKPGGKHLPVIGLTGTNGKTTTKELIRAVLATRYKVSATQGNLNNEIGVPLSLLKITPGTQIAVIEMGASHPGDIRSLVEVSLPDYGLITNVGKGHLLGFGSYEGVKKAKGELYDFISQTGGKIFMNEGLPYLRQMAQERGIEDIIPYGTGHDNAHILEPSASAPFLRMSLHAPESDEEYILETHLVGQYNADNIMAALAVGKYFGVPFSDAVNAIGSYIPSNSRSQMTRTESNMLIVDAYNANPVSMEAALASLESIPADRKAVMLGDMLELGDESANEHRRIVERVLGMNLQHVFFVGNEFRHAAESLGREGECKLFNTSEELAGHIRQNRISGYTILIKGSRGTHMEKVIPEL